MSFPPSDISSQGVDRAEHIDPNITGDNIAAKRVAEYGWDGAEWKRKPLPMFTLPYDEVVITYTSSAKTTISTVVSKLNGATQETITLTQASTTDTYTRS